MVDRFRFGAGALRPTETARYIAANESHLLVHVDFYELLALMPLTRWWQQYVSSAYTLDESTISIFELSSSRLRGEKTANLLSDLVLDSIKDSRSLKGFRDIGPSLVELVWNGLFTPAQCIAMARLVNIAALQIALSLLGITRSISNLEQSVAKMASRVLNTLAQCFEDYRKHVDITEKRDVPQCSLWQVSCNRPAEHAVVASRKTIKADAAIRLFDTGGQGIRWAVIDSGIDARHPALARPEALIPDANVQDGLCLPSISRVIKTLDFTRLAAITSGRVPRDLMDLLTVKYGSLEEAEERIESIRADLANGRILDWTAIEPLLEIDQSNHTRYIPPTDSHGTHVAGIIGSNWLRTSYLQQSVQQGSPPLANSKLLPSLVPPDLLRHDGIIGICPSIELLDLRVFSDKQESDEFAILGALQYVRFLNQSKDKQYVHGVNLSLSLRHDVRNYACGSTPVCLECDRLVGAGIVVVAAAGNFGYDRTYAEMNLGGAYRGQSITDPGNAASVITVGATHRTDPYQYGVSYFSSRGPTGDGRSKPDLVAPGEKITSTVLAGTVASMDGTSMAAPHVSGAAALLLSRNNELMGKPNVVKQILCSSASDLGRERAFQGAGLLDTLRALQSV